MLEFLAGAVCTYAAASAYLASKIKFEVDPETPTIVRLQAGIMCALLLPLMAMHMASRSMSAGIDREDEE